MNYDKLVKALRHCVSDEKGVTKCAGCPYYPDITGCMDRLHTDAAAAIEDLQAELEKKRTADCWGCKCEKLEPKRGKWITHPEVKNIYGGVYIECPFCGEKYVVQNVSDEKFCRNCGADMRAKMEVQE